MTKKDKIEFIRKSRHGARVAGGANLDHYTQTELNEMIRGIAKMLIKESEIVADAYINGDR
jgi:hypothetical protein